MTEIGDDEVLGFEIGAVEGIEISVDKALEGVNEALEIADDSCVLDKALECDNDACELGEAALECVDDFCEPDEAFDPLIFAILSRFLSFLCWARSSTERPLQNMEKSD